MFPEYADLMPQLTASNRQFASLLEKHKELDRTLQAMDSGVMPATREEIEVLKKKKLGCKDRIYSRLREFSKEIHEENKTGHRRLRISRDDHR